MDQDEADSLDATLGGSWEYANESASRPTCNCWIEHQESHDKKGHLQGMSWQKGVQTKAWPDKKGWFAKRSGQKHWIVSTCQLILEYCSCWFFRRACDCLIFRLFSTSFWIAQLVLFPRNLFHQKCTGPHWGGHQVKRPARRMLERRKGKNFTTGLDFIIGNQITSSWLCVWGERVNKSHKII